MVSQQMMLKRLALNIWDQDRSRSKVKWIKVKKGSKPRQMGSQQCHVSSFWHNTSTIVASLYDFIGISQYFSVIGSILFQFTEHILHCLFTGVMVAVDKVVDKLKSMSKQVTTPEEIAQVRL